MSLQGLSLYLPYFLLLHKLHIQPPLWELGSDYETKCCVVDLTVKRNVGTLVEPIITFCHAIKETIKIDCDL